MGVTDTLAHKYFSGKLLSNFPFENAIRNFCVGNRVGGKVEL